MFHQVHLSFFLRNFWQSPLLAFVFRLPAGSMSSSSSDHMLKSELTSPWLYCLGLKIEESWRLQYLTMNNNEGICTVYKITKGSQLGHVLGPSHISLISRISLYSAKAALSCRSSAKHALWIESIFAYYGMQLAVWHFPTDSDLHFGCIQKWGISSIFHISHVIRCHLG